MNCNLLTPLQRDGTSRANRSIKALQPDTILIDGRRLEDFGQYVAQLSTLIHFYDEKNKIHGNWEAFFKEIKTTSDANEGKQKPHIALFVAFVKLLEYVQQEMNALSGKHLDFYYKEVLQLKPKAAIPDKVHVIFELARQFFEHEVEKGTYLKAGKDALGMDVLFKTEKSLVVNPISIEAIQSVFIDNQSVIHAAPKANTADGIAKPPMNGQWLVFGNDKMPEATIGFAIASPQLWMQEGDRTLTFRLGFEHFNAPSLNITLSALLSSEKGWLKQPALLSVEAAKLVIKVQLSPKDPAIVNYAPALHVGNFTTQLPMIQFLFDSKDYKYFHSLGQLKSLNINVLVKEMKNLILENDLGILNGAKPFMPFGAVPKVGSAFLIGNPELFTKPISDLTLHMEWGNLPQSVDDKPYGLANYYDAIKPKKIEQGFFEVDFQLLHDGTWKIFPLVKENNIFKTETDAQSDVIANPKYVIHATDSNYFKQEVTLKSALLIGNKELEPFEEFSNKLQTGFLRIKLKQDFLYNEYVQKVLKDPLNAPKPPYVPVINSFSMDYTSTKDIGKETSLFHIHPFGTAEVAENSVFLMNKIVPEFLLDNENDNEHETNERASGTIYIGVKKVHLANPNKGQIVNILFQVAEGSEDPNQTASKVQWSYLVGNQWFAFKDIEILLDTTANFLRSGIIQFNFPAAMNTEHTTILPKDLFWIKAAVQENSAGVSKMIAIHPQAVQSIFENQENDPTRLAHPLEGNTISQLEERVSEIKKVLQPYPSFGGREPESNAAFYGRVSERLRHKQRAITIWDYEHLVLEAFPEVYKVRCIPHAKADTTLLPEKLLASEYAAGYVTLIVVPNLRNLNAYDPLKPALSQAKLGEIKAFLTKIADNFIEIAVHNPVFEPIYTTFKVKFRAGYDPNFYKRQLTTDLIRYLSPWIYDEGIELAFGGKIHRSAILSFVEKREYVDYVAHFELFHQDNSVENAVASTSASVLIPAEDSQFDIKILSNT
jgi:hypothetical protein